MPYRILNPDGLITWESKLNEKLSVESMTRDREGTYWFLDSSLLLEHTDGQSILYPSIWRYVSGVGDDVK